MIERGKTYVVMGLLSPESIAYAIGQAVLRHGGRVVYTAQNPKLKALFFDKSSGLSEAEKASLDIRFCDVTDGGQVRDLFAGLGQVAGVVHSIAYANPATCLGAEFHTEATDDILKSYHISSVSLATVARCAQPAMGAGGSIVALSFDTRHVYPSYNWMGVHKAALEAIVRALAARHGRELIRVNAVSAGPLWTKAASKIPEFDHLLRHWRETSPIPWDPEADRQAVADAVLFLLGPGAAKITGQILNVDGGASIIGGNLKPDAPFAR